MSFEILQMTQENQKSPAKRGALFVYLAGKYDVASLRTLGTLFDSELDLLAFLQVAESAIALNSGIMDENVLSTFALDKAETFVTIEPFDGTSYTFRHCICLLWQL